MNIKVTIEGTSPLLMNKFIDASDDKAKKTNYVDQEEAEKRLYLDHKKNLCQPGEHIEAAMIKAAVNFKYSGKKTFKDFIKSGVFVAEDMILHKVQKWEIDKRAVVINRNRIMRCRPILPFWELSFTLNVINEDLKKADLEEILSYAGKFCGIGDYRPKFGRFIITEFKNGEAK